MANVPPKPRNTKGEPPSLEDTQHGFNRRVKTLMGEKLSLTFMWIWKLNGSSARLQRLMI